jgi:hypothetical protein
MQTTTQKSPTHGLANKRPVLEVEDSDEFRAFATELLDQLDPATPLEFYFGKRAVGQAWRIQRAQCYETVVVDTFVKAAAKTDKTKPISFDFDSLSQGSRNDILGQVLSEDFRIHGTLDKIIRYELRLEWSMMRCLREFRNIRGEKTMNFSSLRQYVRDFQPRPQDFPDQPMTNTQNKANSQAPSASDGMASTETDKTKPISHDTSTKQDGNPLDSFTNWRLLYWGPKGRTFEIDDDPFSVPMQHRPNPPEDGQFIFRKNWANRILNMVQHPVEMRRKLTEPELNELADQVLMMMPNPTQFLWDFNLIEKTAYAESVKN